MPNSDQPLLAAAPNRNWAGGLVALAAVSIGGGFGINAILNPPLASGSADGTTTTQTVTGDKITYRYGEVQLEITATNGQIESINEVVATATDGYDAVFPVLNAAALKAQSADFGNASGATFCTDAYQEALASALSKLQ